MRRTTAKEILGRGTKVVLGAFGVVLLAAVPVLGLTTLGSDFFPTGQASEESAGAAQVSNGPFTFDAPLVSMRRVHPSEARDGRPASAEPDEAAVVLADWRFTQTQTVGQVIAADILKLAQTNPLAFLFLASQVPTLVGDFQAFLGSLPPAEQAAVILFILAFLNHPVSSPTPSPVSGNK